MISFDFCLLYYQFPQQLRLFETNGILLINTELFIFQFFKFLPLLWFKISISENVLQVCVGAEGNVADFEEVQG